MDTDHYYVSEGCPYFAIALQEIFGYELKTVVDRTKTENYGDKDYPLYAHIYAYDPETDTAIDVKGTQTERNIRRRFNDINFSPSLEPIARSSLDDLMGETKPFFSPRDSDIQDAKEIILEDKSKYRT